MQEAPLLEGAGLSQVRCLLLLPLNPHFPEQRPQELQEVQLPSMGHEFSCFNPRSQ